MPKETFGTEDMYAYLPLFIEAEYPKDTTKDRGNAIVACVLFIQWLSKNVKTRKNEVK